LLPLSVEKTLGSGSDKFKGDQTIALVLLRALLPFEFA